MKTDILITDICLPGKQTEQAIIENCCLAINGDSIVHIGPVADFSKVEAKTIINGHNQLAMPGLINTHCHGAMTLFRGLADDMELGQWLNEHIFPAEAANVNPDMVYWCTKLAAAEMILSGTTTVADGYFFEYDAARAFADAGMRAVAAQGAKELARTKKVPLFIHVAESRFEADMITDMQGGSPIRHLDALGILDPATICVHCVWADDEDLVVLAESGAGVVVCPQSHLKLASGISPLETMLKKGIPVGLGTDGAAGNNSLDMFREMDICAKIQKIRFLDPVAVPAAEVLAMATTGGASVLGMETSIGSLTAGKKADIILINLDTPHLQPMQGTDLLVYAAGGADVQTVLINGQLVMQDWKLLSFDLAETLHQVRLLADRIKLQH
jgi:5-methylthioadenosine/S-adenosylhomocysteine deaminase